MPDKIKIGDKWYVSATAASPEENPQVLKNDETFVMFDRFGDLQVLLPGAQGIYHEDTRFLSHQELLIDGARPLYLGSTVKENSRLLIVELMNPDLARHGEVSVCKGSVHIFRAKLLWEDACYEHLRLTNHGLDAVEFTLSMSFDADFADLFELRGMRRAHSGERLPSEVAHDSATLRYLGLDRRERRTRLCFSPTPQAIDDHRASFSIHLEPGAERHLYCTISCLEQGETYSAPLHYDEAFRRNEQAQAAAARSSCGLTTSNPLVNLWIERARSDLSMLTTHLPTGPYPYAGVPWYATTFGRDGILTAREYLWLDPSLARGVLAFLAQTQATEADPQRDAEPGKILHEARKSEMAATGEIPFGRYYGTVDATPLFVALAGAYHQRSGDLDFIRSIWPNILRALDWIDHHGDSDGDGFVEYARHSNDGLVQQGWKDSQDSVFHADGRLAEPPIALCEVQGYVYEAKLLAAGLARRLGEDALAERLDVQARELKQRFVQAFWCEEIGSYAIALDGDKQQCKVASSNAGHALWTGIATPQHARRIVAGLMGDDFFSGFGIRTIPKGTARYNPMSYHNGSVWPHDNALIAAGMARYGHTDEAMRVLSALFDASLYFDAHRLPELFCGFPRRPNEGPTLYPVACSPQAWASAAVFAMLQACLGLQLQGDRRELSLRSPRLPEFIRWMKVDRLAVGDDSVDLLLRRYETTVGIDVTQRTGEIDVVVAV